MMVSCSASDDGNNATSIDPPAPVEESATNQRAHSFRLDRPVSELVGHGAPLHRTRFEPKDQAHDSDATHLLLLVETDGVRFEVLKAKEVAQPLPRPRTGVSPKAWEARARGAAGSTVVSVPIEDPRLVRGEFPPQDAEQPAQMEDVLVEKEKVVFAVRVPTNSRGIDFVKRSPLARAPVGVRPVPPKLAAAALSGETLVGKTEIRADLIERL